tara:strand:+ start:592 stop:795 length:204 start_codon:yes stop_codon:yes gene_type:complete
MEVLMKNFKQFLESIDYYKIPGLSQEPLEPKVRVTPSEVKKEKDKEEKDYYTDYKFNRMRKIRRRSR